MFWLRNKTKLKNAIYKKYLTLLTDFCPLLMTHVKKNLDPRSGETKHPDLVGIQTVCHSGVYKVLIPKKIQMTKCSIMQMELKVNTVKPVLCGHPKSRPKLV